MKNLKKNYIYNLIYQIVTMISPLITAPYIARILGAENIGKYSYTQSIASYIILLTTLGTTMYAQREIAFNQGNKRKQTKSFIELIMIRIGCGIFGLFAFLLLVVFYEQYRLLFAIQCIELLANIICIDWFYAGNEEFRITMIRNLIIRILNIICIFIFVKDANDLYKYVLIIVFGTFIGNASLWFKMRRYLTRLSFDNLSIKAHICGSLSVFAAQISASIYSMLDKTMIGIITNSNLENGYYEQAQKIEKIALTFVTALGTVIMPRISKAHSGNNTASVENSIYISFNYMWLIALPMTFGLIATAPSFIPWFYGSGYEKSIIIIQILALLLVAIGINNILGVQYLMATKQEKILTITELVGAVVNVLLNLFLIQKIASVGAAIASVAAEGVIAAVQLFYVRKALDIKKLFSLSVKYLISSIVMLIMIEIFKLIRYSQTTIVDTMFLVIIGVITYFVMLVILHEQFLIGTIKRMLMVTKNKKMRR